MPIREVPAVAPFETALCATHSEAATGDAGGIPVCEIGGRFGKVILWPFGSSGVAGVDLRGVGAEWSGSIAGLSGSIIEATNLRDAAKFRFSCHCPKSMRLKIV